MSIGLSVPRKWFLKRTSVWRTEGQTDGHTDRRTAAFLSSPHFVSGNKKQGWDFVAIMWKFNYFYVTIAIYGKLQHHAEPSRHLSFCCEPLVVNTIFRKHLHWLTFPLAHWYVIGICKLGSFDTAHDPAHDLFLEVAEVKTYHYCIAQGCWRGTC